MVQLVDRKGRQISLELINQRVLVLNRVVHLKRITSHIPPLTIPIPDAVTDSQAVSVVGGLDTALSCIRKL